MASLDDINSTAKNIVTNIASETSAIQALGTTLATGNSNVVTALNAEVVAVQGLGTTLATGNANLVAALNAITTAIINTFTRISGTFTLSNATVTVVSQPGILSGGNPLWEPQNATAALTVRTLGLYLSTVSPGASFSVSTQTGVAAGTESFYYVVFNPG